MKFSVDVMPLEGRYNILVISRTYNYSFISMAASTCKNIAYS
jgi:hypothetical protein